MGIRMKTNHTRLYGLNLSRCLGDKFLKNEDLGLSAEPYISPVLRFDLSQRAVVVLASDGLWDVMEPVAAMQVGLICPPYLLYIGRIAGQDTCPAKEWNPMQASLLCVTVETELRRGRCV